MASPYRIAQMSRVRGVTSYQYDLDKVTDTVKYTSFDISCMSGPT